MLLNDLLNMLDPRGNNAKGRQFLSGGTNFSQDNKGSLITDPNPPGYFQTVHKKNTVKELLMMRRQKWNYSFEDNNFEPKCKHPKLETFVSPYLIGTPTPVNPNVTPEFTPPAVQNGNTSPQQLQHLHGQMVPTAEVKMTLFHWQVQQEAQRIQGVSLDLLNMQDADGDTFLHIAVAQGRRALVYVLAGKMAQCGSLDVKEHNGQTALQIAAATNQHLILQDLILHGAQINTQDFWGRSPLHVCAEKGYFLSLQSIWTSLVRCGQLIDIEQFNYDGLTPLHAAVLSHNGVLKELRTLENPCTYMSMELAKRRHKYIECIKTLMLMGASCGKRDLKSGRTCLHIASEEANMELLQLFLDLESSSLSTVNDKTFSGNTALHIVSSLQNHKAQVQAVRLLMRKGADPGSRNFENELPSQLVPEGAIGEKVRQILKGRNVHA
ncbi:NF-kappa-B inhibitor zeta I-kappa-B-zeta [Channa argus]|uniref:NF-kappa-B inhibitor zeta I-kappa-B-zeta n=1 Tax=Channa argus TaxID=215402 RepID=A0A6G1PDS3_CHAAH|nr:NF-kappa-B inhibitor zeta I-kappa-B-zeta [Channa argus]